MPTSDLVVTYWPATSVVVGAIATATPGGYAVEFYDADGSTLRVTGLTAAALVKLAGTACVLAEEIEWSRWV